MNHRTLINIIFYAKKSIKLRKDHIYKKLNKTAQEIKINIFSSFKKHYYKHIFLTSLNTKKKYLKPQKCKIIKKASCEFINRK